MPQPASQRRAELLEAFRSDWRCRRPICGRLHALATGEHVSRLQERQETLQ
jgi:hypothetical protein